jgi:hypothetical protein
MDMIGLYRERQNLPTLLSTLLLDEGLTVCGDTATKDRFTALGTPDQVVDNKVDTVFISLIIHVDTIEYNDMLINKHSSLESRLKPEKAPNRYRANGAACGGLKSISVNQKIEGFFDVCQAKGLTGEQGVLIPHSNVPHLMLREDVVDAVTAGQFHVWAVKTIDEGIAMLTGMPAGARDAAERFPAGTLNERVDRRLREFAECWKAFQAVGATECR